MIRDITIGQYFPGKRAIHKMDPRIKILLSILYIVMLFVADNMWGLLLGVLVVVLRYLASTCVRSVRDLQDLEPFDYVAELTAENAQAGPLLAAYLKTVCAKRGLTQVVLLASQALQPAAQSAVQSAEQLLRQSGLETVSCTMDTADPAALQQILTAQSVVPVVELDRTDCCTLHQEMELCRRENIPVLAGIVL